MHLIDQYAYSNRLRPVDPAQKAGLAALVIALCLLLDRPAVGVLATAWMWALATLWARLPARLFGRTLLAEGLFLVLSVAGVAISLGTSAPADSRWALAVGPLWIAVGQAELTTALHLLCRALGGAAALNFLILTTPLVDLIELARRVGTPALLIDLMTLIYRSIFVLLESLTQMATAQDSRLGYRTPGRAMNSAGLLGSRLFIDAYQRSRRLQLGMESRGYNGDLRVLPISYRRDGRCYSVYAAITTSLILAWVLL